MILIILITVHVCIDSPGLHAALQSLQTGLNEVERLEEQRGAGPTDGATHEGFDRWVSLRGRRGRKGGLFIVVNMEVTLFVVQLDAEVVILLVTQVTVYLVFVFLLKLHK